MPVVASVDYAAKRIYLSAETVDADLDTLAVYREVRALRRTNEAHRTCRPMIVAGGNIEKIAAVSYTPSYVQLLYGCLIVPYNGVSHRIRVIRDTFTDTGLAGRDCFDRTPLPASIDVDIDVAVPQVEIRQVTVAGASVITGDIDAVPTTAEIVSAMLADQTIKALLAANIGNQTGAGTTQVTYTYNGVTVTADVPLPQQIGNRTNVVITGS